MVGTAAVDLNRVLGSRRAPADHRCEPTRSEPPALSRTFSGGPWCCRVAKHIAAAPHCFDVMIAAGCLGELFAQIADKNIDDLELRRVHPVVEVIEKHLLGHNGALVHAEQLEDRVFLAGHPHWFVMYRDNAGFEIDDKLPSSDCRLSIARGPANPAGSRYLVRDSR